MANTNDTQMNIYLKTIETKVHGKDIKQAIHDALQYTFNKSFQWADGSASTANQSMEKAANALQLSIENGRKIDSIQSVTNQLTDKVNSTDARVDNIIAHNNDTEGNTELIDIRTGYSGGKYSSAGSAVRYQLTDVNHRIDELLKEKTVLPIASGQYVSYNDWLVKSWNDNSAPDHEILTHEIDNVIGYLVYYRVNNSNSSERRSVFIPVTRHDDGAGEFIHEEVLIDGTFQRIERRVTGLMKSFIIDSAYVLNNNLSWSLNGSDLSITNNPATRTITTDYILISSVVAVRYMLPESIKVEKDSELIDCRIGMDGTVYETAGEAIRQQISKYMSTAVIDAINGTY